MKTNIVKRCFAIATTALLAFTSCQDNKESKIISILQSENSGKATSEIVLGHYTEASGITLAFDKAKFLEDYQEVVRETKGANYLVEDISLNDETPNDPSTKADLHITIFETDTATTINTYLLLEKRVVDNNEVEYYFNAHNEKTIVVCRSVNCTDGYGLNAEKNGCYGCINADSTADFESFVEYTPAE